MPTNFKRKTNNIQEKVRTAANSAKEYLEETRDKTEDYMRQKPWQSVLIAAGIGVAIGAGITATLMRRKESSLFDRLMGLF